MNSCNRMFQIIYCHNLFTMLKKMINILIFQRMEELNLKIFPRDTGQNCDLVLKGLSFEIQSNEKVGCVGRTGAGTSTIIQATFNISEIRNFQESKLLISDQDIRKLGIQKVRSNIGIISFLIYWDNKKKFSTI
ncbi:unnamed protein product [Paramecium primaurelia]|uniref:ABC transporter domain-containing protein n=1 Tax=Paramecium primaurelia TaxID=5886 RepID=A0A8S1MIP7_PARPR|nr:unnamed protein product [Paramecium primaurelia]